MNFARLNHILIPPRHDNRERWREGLFGKLSWPLRWGYAALSQEGQVLSIASLFVGVAGLQIEYTQVYILWGAIIGAIIGAIVIRRVVNLDDVEVEVLAPPRVSVGEPVTFSLELRNRGDRGHRNIRLRGPFLPWDGDWTLSRPRVATLPPGEVRRCEARATFRARGEHYLDPFTAVAVAPLGLSVGRGASTRGCRFFVVPRLAQVDDIDLPVSSRHQPGGVAQASRTGEAMELFGVRPYRFGDSVRDLHVRTWARRGVPHVKEYQQEFFTRIGVVLDTDRAASTERRFEAAVSLAAGVVQHLSGGEALIDVLVMGGEVHTLTLGRSLGYLEQALDLLSTAEVGPELDPERLERALDPFIGRLSAVIFITESSDAKRTQVRTRIERHGVRCRVLRVVDGAPDGPDDVSVEAIEGEASLRL